MFGESRDGRSTIDRQKYHPSTFVARVLLNSESSGQFQRVWIYGKQKKLLAPSSMTYRNSLSQFPPDGEDEKHTDDAMHSIKHSFTIHATELLIT